VSHDRLAFPAPELILGPAIKDEEALLNEGVEARAREEFLGAVAAGDMVTLGLPVIFEADDKAPMVLVTGPQPGQAGISEVSKQATARTRRAADAGCHAPAPG
jgi:hypothetical protein